MKGRLIEQSIVKGDAANALAGREFLPLLHWRRGAGIGGPCFILATRFMGSSFVLRACIGTMNRFEKLRRSAMSIAPNAPWSLPCSVGAACSFDGSWKEEQSSSEGRRPAVSERGLAVSKL